MQHERLALIERQLGERLHHERLYLAARGRARHWLGEHEFHGFLTIVHLIFDAVIVQFEMQVIQTKIPRTVKKQTPKMIDVGMLLAAQFEDARPDILECIFGGGFVVHHALAVIEQRVLVLRVQFQKRFIAASEECLLQSLIGIRVTNRRERRFVRIH